MKLILLEVTLRPSKGTKRPPKENRTKNGRLRKRSLARQRLLDLIKSLVEEGWRNLAASGTTTSLAFDSTPTGGRAESF